MAVVSRNALSDGQSNVDGSDINSIYSDLFTEFNGSIDNTNIKAAAAIAYSKLNLSGAILNTDISSSAAIAYSKLATLTGGYLVVGNSSNVAAAVAVSGDVAMANDGSTTVTDLTITSEAAGDILYFDGSNWKRLAKGTAGQVLRMNAGATAPEWGSLLGAWTDRSGSVAGGSLASTLAATDLLVCAYMDSNNADATVIGYTDSSNPPTTVRAKAVLDRSSETVFACITMPVKNGDYYKLDFVGGSGTATVYTIILGG